MPGIRARPSCAGHARTSLGRRARHSSTSIAFGVIWEARSSRITFVATSHGAFTGTWNNSVGVAFGASEPLRATTVTVNEGFWKRDGAVWIGRERTTADFGDGDTGFLIAFLHVADPRHLSARRPLSSTKASAIFTARENVSA